MMSGQHYLQHYTCMVYCRISYQCEWTKNATHLLKNDNIASTY